MESSAEEYGNGLPDNLVKGLECQPSREMSETTFLDAIDYCEIHGHDPLIEYDWHTIDIAGTKARDEKCNKCGKTRSVIKHDNNLRLSETIYPDGKWK